MNKFYKSEDIIGILNGSFEIPHESETYLDIIVLEILNNHNYYTIGVSVFIEKQFLELIENQEEIHRLNKLVIFK